MAFVEAVLRSKSQVALEITLVRPEATESRQRLDQARLRQFAELMPEHIRTGMRENLS
ncbi:hypothetical protein ACA106_05780 [Agrobacterium pusense]|uniref:hypothetical protein n=1 Tax=Agrobacterium pusense TaxID=648995 RepID=UPI00130E21FF|nr:hypothetical protein [Agrobacterium pusense]